MPGNQGNPAAYVDCVSYGAYTGGGNVHTSAPAPLAPFGRSLERVSETHSSAIDFACVQPANPENNVRQVGSIAGSEGCPFCGDGNQDAGEQCDGMDDGACPGLCLASCLCENTCGNEVIEGAEACDGSDDAACPGRCQVNCTCGPDGALEKADQKCVSTLGKASASAVSAYGKAAVSCVSAFAGGKTLDPPLLCVDDDPRGRLAKVEAKFEASLAKACSASPYALDCVAPCDDTDAGGLSDAVDDEGELVACLGCLNRAVSVGDVAPLGLHGALIDGATLATSQDDKALARCQASLVKGAEKLFATRLKAQLACVKAELKAGTAPSALAGACVGADPRGKIAASVTKLEAQLAKCPASPVFDAGACTGLSGGPLAQCVGRTTSCSACRWGRTLLGDATLDCDLIDNASIDSSCP